MTFLPHTITLKSPTGRVRLVPPRSDDDEAVSLLRSHPVTLRYLRFLPLHISADEVRIRRESREENPRIVDFHIHIVNDKGPAILAGMTGIFNIDEQNESCEAGIIVAPDMHGRGIATEALYTLLQFVFEDRKFHRVTFETGEDNIPMRSLLENILEAKLEAERRECWKDGPSKYTNVRSYSILEWEWSDRVKGKLKAMLSPLQ